MRPESLAEGGPATLTNHRWRAAWLTAYVALSAALIVITVRGLASGFSYWFDELYSVVHNSASIDVLWRHRSDDVHPPLYSVLLWAWMAAWGSSEAASRSLSAIFAILAALPPFLLVRRYGLIFAIAASMLIVSSPYTIYYAQESRNYGLVQFLCVLTVCAFADERRRVFFVAAVLLGLTHYFGAILAVVLLGLHWLFRRRSKREFVIVTALVATLFVWPIYQLTAGAAGFYFSSGFWVTTTPAGSILVAAKAFSPQTAWLIGRFGGLPVVAMILGLAVLGVATVKLAPAAIRATFLTFSRKDQGVALLVPAFVLVVLAVAIISIRRPIAFERYFIIFVPIHALLLAWIIGRAHVFKAYSLLSAGFVLYCVLGVYVALDQLEDKTRPLEDWKTLAQWSARTARSSGATLYFVEGAPGEKEKFFEFYLPKDAQVRPVSLDELPKLSGPAIVAFGGVYWDTGKHNPITSYFAKSGRSHRIVTPRQAHLCQTGMVLLPAALISTAPAEMRSASAGTGC